MEEDFALPLPRVLAMNEAEARLGGGSNEEVVTALYEQLRPALLRYVYHLTGSARDAEDLVQIYDYGCSKSAAEILLTSCHKNLPADCLYLRRVKSVTSRSLENRKSVVSPGPL